MPRGMQHKCELGIMHFPTVWDHVQRELQRALQAQQGVDKAVKRHSEDRPPGSQEPSLDPRGAPAGAGAPVALDLAAPDAVNADPQGPAAAQETIAQERRPAAWTDSPTWLLLKQLARSGVHSEQPAPGIFPEATCRIACWQDARSCMRPRAPWCLKGGKHCLRPACLLLVCR